MSEERKEAEFNPLESRSALLQAAKDLSNDFEAQLSKRLGCQVKFAVSRFVLSAKGNKAAELQAMVAKLDGVTVIESKYDEKKDCTFCLFRVRITRTTKQVFTGGNSNG